MQRRASDNDLAPARAALDGNDAQRLAHALGDLRARFPGDPEIARLEAQAALARGDREAALRRLAQALALDSHHVPSWHDLGTLYINLHRPDQAIEAYQRALTVDGRAAPSWSGLGVALDMQGRPQDAAEAFRQALTVAPGDARPRVRLAAALLAAGDLPAAEREAMAGCAALPDDPDAAFVLGNVLAARGDQRGAAQAFMRAAATGPDRAEAEHNLALALDALGELHGAARACERALALAPHLTQTLAQLVHLKRQLCEWQGLDALSEELRKRVREGSDEATPFSFLSEPATPEEQLMCAQAWAARTLRNVEPMRRRTSFPPRAIGSGRVRVGFVSSGFGNHPTALLVADLIEQLRHTSLTTVGFATSRDDGGAMRPRLRAAFHEFQDVAGLSHEAMAGRIYDARIDVLVDLRGYGGGGVSEVFALRPAPVQVNWLAYPGTSGAPFIDYLIADRHVVPDAQRAAYSEALVRLPHCFQPNDTTRRPPAAPSREACGLPPEGFVFASFNNSYKIAPEAFAAWMRVLRDVPGSVLWLLATRDAHAQANLREVARAAQVDPARLVFAPKLPHDEYLARLAHADLFLDTWPYNAHTTASDALWAGVPVLTLPGATFASRVASSLVHVAGIDELVARDVADYKAKAIVYARSAELRARVLARLERARRESPLFDMPRFARAFEKAVLGMAERARYSQPAADFEVEDAR
jgi:predicted O-linked N-acetylglucosamine transferase (SPINDLY family)